jgi:hypothetical protein
VSRVAVLATVVAPAVFAGCVIAAAGKAMSAPLPRVTTVTDSVGGVLYWSDDARHVLGRGLDFVLETKTCRRLVSVGCPAYGERPPSALVTIQGLGPSLGPIVVVDVGYNDLADGYGDGLDRVMRALLAAGVEHVVWVTLEESRDPWLAINAQIRAAPARWPYLTVADWAPVAAEHPEWFDDGVHMNGLGGMGFARFLRPIVLGACGSPCRFASLAPEVAMLRLTVGTHTIELRWRGNEAAIDYDLEIRRGRAWWETVLRDRPVTSYRLNGTPGSRIRVRVRARDWDGVPGAWTPPESLRFKPPRQRRAT